MRLEIDGGCLPVRLEALDDHLFDVHGDVECSPESSVTVRRLFFFALNKRTTKGGDFLARMAPVPNVAQRFGEGGGQEAK